MSEEISALMDGAPLPGVGGDRLEAIGSDPVAAMVWEHYHTVRYVLRGESRGVPVSILRGDLAARIRDQIHDEPTCLAPAPLPELNSQPIRWSGRRWLQAAGSLAVAASVIVAVTIALRSDPVPDPAPRAVAAAPATQWHTDQPEFESDLNTFLVQHGEFSTPSGLNGLIAYAKIVSYDARR